MKVKLGIPNSLNHRGSDYSGFYCNKIKENLNIYLLHTRLSILDLIKGQINLWKMKK